MFAEILKVINCYATDFYIDNYNDLPHMNPLSILLFELLFAIYFNIHIDLCLKK
jgi:hypothetical protein